MTFLATPISSGAELLLRVKTPRRKPIQATSVAEGTAEGIDSNQDIAARRTEAED
jgi:hypothetical protein